MKDDDATRSVSKYSEVRPTWEDYTRRLQGLIEDIVTDGGIPVAQVDSRTKSLESFEDKLARKGDGYTDPLIDVTDLTAVRVITYYLDDVERVGIALANSFVVDSERSVDKAAALDPDQFGYVSVQYILRLSDERLAFPEWSKFGGMWAEVQIRTVSQHAWSSIDHRLNYKSKAAVPRDLRRSLSRLSALFELADAEFAALRDRVAALQSEYQGRVEAGDLDLAIDSASVEAYLSASGLGEVWVARAVDLGYTVGDEANEAVDTADLLAMLQAAAIENVRGLDSLLRDAETWGLRALRVVARIAIDQDGLQILTTPRSLVTDLVAVGSTIPGDVLDSLGYAGWYTRAILAARSERG